MVLGEMFFKYKQEVNTLRIAVDNHFNRVITQIEAGLPDVVDDKPRGEEDEDDIFGGAKEWTCMVCTTRNPMSQNNCQICRVPKPSIKVSHHGFGEDQSS
jgi:hypothetical protein